MYPSDHTSCPSSLSPSILLSLKWLPTHATTFLLFNIADKLQQSLTSDHLLGNGHWTYSRVVYKRLPVIKWQWFLVRVIGFGMQAIKRSNAIIHALLINTKIICDLSNFRIGPIGSWIALNPIGHFAYDTYNTWQGLWHEFNHAWKHKKCIASTILGCITASHMPANNYVRSRLVRSA